MREPLKSKSPKWQEKGVYLLTASIVTLPG